MALVQVSDKLLSQLAMTAYDFDPNVTTAVDVSWQDMRDHENFACAFFRTIGTSTVVFKILANPNSDGGGTDVTIKSDPVLVPDAVGDIMWLECTAEEIAQADAATGTARYVSANVSFATSTDEGVVIYIRKPKRAYDALTAASTIA